MPKKRRSPSSKKKSIAPRGKRRKSKKSPSQKSRRKSAKTSASRTSGSSSISMVTKKKKKWTDMQIFRVPLDPTQAVLSCCDQPNKGNLISSVQCVTVAYTTLTCNGAQTFNQTS